MNGRRLLADMLSEVASSALDTLVTAPVVRVREVSVTLPVEIALKHTAEGPQLFGDLPRTVTRTAFDIEPGRLHVRWLSEVD